MDDIRCGNLETREHEINNEDAVASSSLSETDNNQSNCFLRNTTLNEDRLDDLTSLSYLNDAAVLNTIYCRYQDNIIYTYSGLVLVALNPYCDLKLYGDSLIQAYSGKSRGELEPHLFAVAEDAFRSMQRGQKNQSIIISGESGSGKTISARYVMRYFASAANAHLSDSLVAASSLVEARVLASNPILEAFGNAKTTRNDNSSRFGKYVQIFFDAREEITGAAIQTYLLEKTRVTKQCKGERNYHIFYQLLESSNSQLKEDLKLSGFTWKDFEYLKAAGGSIENVQDSKEFDQTVESMEIAGFTKETQSKIFKILSAVLYLGNVSFTEEENDSSKVSEGSMSNLTTFAELMNYYGEIEDLERCFTSKLLVTKHESVEMKLSVKQAEAAKDAIAKFLYSRVFDYIVNQLNELLSPSKRVAELKFIGVLDIYGFEKFDTNSFEQFCINYANEKLQHEFNQQVFKLEQELYEREQIKWSFINFSDNQPCIDLIEMRGGILDLLDEECRFPNGGDVSFLDKIKIQVPKKGDEISKYLGSDPLEMPETFTIKHFAYNVAYSVAGFLEKNRDLVPGEIDSIIGDCNKAMLGSSNESENRSTTGSSFRGSLNDLMKKIQSTQVHYIRCIKPNNSKGALCFESDFVMQQLRAGGIIETIKISAAGYPARWSFEEFFNRYRLLCPVMKIKSDNDSNFRELSEELLGAQNDLEADEYQIGKSQIFLRAGILAKLEQNRSTTLKNAATLIQSRLKAHWALQAVKVQLKGVIFIQSVFKSYQAREKMEEMQRSYSKMLIESAFHRHQSIRGFKMKVEAIRTLQHQWKSHLKMKSYSEDLRHRMALTIQKSFRGKKSALIANYKSYSSQKIQVCWRRFEALEELKALKIEARSFDKLKETSFGLEKKVIDLTRELDEIRLENSEGANEREEKMRQMGKQLEQSISRISELEAEASSYKARLEESQKDLSSLKVEYSRDLAERESLHQEAIRGLERKHEEQLKNVNGDNGDLLGKYEDLLGQKDKLELKFAKVEQYVRALMSNQVQSCGGDGEVLQHSSPTSSIDKMASQNSLMNFISDENDSKLIKFTSTNQVLEGLLRSESIIEELYSLVQMTRILEIDFQADQEELMRPSRIIYSWLTLSLSVPELNELTEHRMNLVLEKIRETLSESTDDKKCSLWLTNLINLYGMIHFFITERENLLKMNHEKIVKGIVDTENISSANESANTNPSLSANANTNSNASPSFSVATTQISASELAPAIILLIRAEVMRLISDIYSAWLKELCRWFGRAGISGILDHQALQNYKVRSPAKRRKSDKFLESVLNSLNNSKGQDEEEDKVLSIGEFLDSLDELLNAFVGTTLDLEIVQNVLLILFKNVSVLCFNQFLLRRNFVSWKRAIQIQYNLSRLEDWCEESLTSFGVHEGCVGCFEPLLEAVKVIQLAKTRGVDSGTLQQCAPSLSSLQIRKLLSNYVPDDFEDGPVPIDLIRQFPPPSSTTATTDFLLQSAGGGSVEKMFAFPVVLKERKPPRSEGMAAALPLDMPPTLWKLFLLYLK
jgi:myosin V